MKPQLVVALQGTPHVGKTTTLSMLVDFLLHGVVVDSGESREDVCEVVDYQGKKIVIATCGDNKAYMEKNVEFFNSYPEADAYICAVRSWGVTHSIIDEFAKSKQTRTVYITKPKSDDIIKPLQDILIQLQVDVDEETLRHSIVSGEDYIQVEVYAYGDFDPQGNSMTVDFASEQELGVFSEWFDLPDGEYAPTYMKLSGLAAGQKYDEGYYTLYVCKKNLESVKYADSENTDYAYFLDAADRAIFLLKSKKISVYSFPYTSLPSRSIWRCCSLCFDRNISTLVVKKVGNANYNELKEENEVAIVYDFGSLKTDDTEKEKLVDDAKNQYSAQTQKPVLIISHWDRDHYNLLHRLDKDIMQSLFCCVICPNIFFSISAIRVFKMILKSDVEIRPIPVYAEEYHRPKSKVVSLCVANPFSNPKIYISIGERTGVKGNDCCIGLTVCGTSGKLAALTGDMDYSRVLEFASDVDYLVVPHHGSYRSIDDTKDVAMIPTVRSEALISADDLHGHPNQNTIDLYAKKKIKCFCTHKCSASSPWLTCEDDDLSREI